MKKGNERIKRFFEQEDEQIVSLLFSDLSYSKAATKRILDVLSDTTSNDLYIFLCGIENCMPNKEPTYARVRLYTLHYVINGAGFLNCADKIYELKTGDIFVSYADEIIDYYPDKHNPWSYIYFSFAGIMQDEAVKQMGFSAENCVVHAKNEKIENGFRAVLNNYTQTGGRSFRTLGAVYSLIGEIANLGAVDAPVTSKESYIKQAVTFIVNNETNLSVEDVANSCALSREYLTRICKQTIGVSLKELITICRLRTARNYLRNTRVTVSALSEQLGFNNKKYFVRVFRETFGMTPLQYREREHAKIKGNN